MKRLLIIVFLALFASSQAEEGWRPIPRYADLIIESADQGNDGVFYEPSVSDSHEHKSQGFSAGSGLRSIAQGSAHKAHTAVERQHAAAGQAAFAAQSALAQSAVQSAATANAALAGKKALYENLQVQAEKAHHILDAEISQLELAKKSSSNAEVSAQHARNHVSVLVAALNSAKMVAEQAKKSANEAASELTSQKAMIGKRKSALKEVEDKLKEARVDYGETKEAAEKATLAAHEAQKTAQLAGNEVSNQILNMAAVENAYSAANTHQNSADLYNKRAAKKH